MGSKFGNSFLAPVFGCTSAGLGSASGLRIFMLGATYESFILKRVISADKGPAATLGSVLNMLATSVNPPDFAFLEPSSGLTAG